MLPLPSKHELEYILFKNTLKSNQLNGAFLDVLYSERWLLFLIWLMNAHEQEVASVCSSSALKGTYFSEQPSAVSCTGRSLQTLRCDRGLCWPCPAQVAPSFPLYKSTKALEDSRYTKQCFLLPSSIHKHHLLDFQAALE